MAESRKTKIINVPHSLLALCVAIFLCHLVVSFLPDALVLGLYLDFALWPARLRPTEIIEFPGGAMQGVFNLVSYNFLHGGWEHMLINLLWLFAFGSPVAYRLGGARFLLLFFLGSALGGLAEVMTVSATALFTPIIGASAGVSAMIGAAARFAFFDFSKQTTERPIAQRRLLGLRETFTIRTNVVFILVWVALNGALAFLGGAGFSPSGAVVAIAWVAHLGGFVVGLLLIGFIAPPTLSASGGPGNVAYGGWYKKKNRKKD